MEWIMARDQYGNCEHGLDAKHPRADLLRRLGRTSASKQYTEKEGSSNPHTGYIIAGRWFTFYFIVPWEGK